MGGSVFQSRALLICVSCSVGQFKGRVEISIISEMAGEVRRGKLGERGDGQRREV